MSWDPQQYLKFGGERLRPVHDLLARVGLDAPAGAADLGCGTGSVTELMRARWPAARIIGIDNSATMLDRARGAVTGVDWQLADLATWRPAAPLDLIVSNAALQWLDDHAMLFPRLLSFLAPGGVLAVQMPAQHRAPSHQIGYRIADEPRYRDALRGLVRRRPFSRRRRTTCCCARTRARSISGRPNTCRRSRATTPSSSSPRALSSAPGYPPCRPKRQTTSKPRIAPPSPRPIPNGPTASPCFRSGACSWSLGASPAAARSQRVDAGGNIVRADVRCRVR